MQTVGDIVARIDAWTDTRASGISPVHEATDAEKYTALVASMTEYGWHGAPLVVDGDQALTGAHRFSAAQATNTEIPCIQIEDVCRVFGVDWSAHRAEYETDYQAHLDIAEKLPAAVVQYLGLDLH